MRRFCLLTRLLRTITGSCAGLSVRQIGANSLIVVERLDIPVRLTHFFLFLNTSLKIATSVVRPAPATNLIFRATHRFNSYSFSVRAAIIGRSNPTNAKLRCAALVVCDFSVAACREQRRQIVT